MTAATVALAASTAAIASRWWTPMPVTHAQGPQSRIVYTRAEGEWPFDVYVSDANGQGEVQLTDNDDIEFNPRWSRDGREIAYHVPKDSAPVRIVRMPAAGGTPTPIVIDDGIGFDAGFPAWHPTRDCIAYAGDHPAADGRSDMKVWCAGEGTRVVRVTDDRDESSSDWSPDGGRLVVESQPIEDARNDRSYWDIYVMDADGTNYGPLVAADGSSECDPRWSPEGRRLAFVSYPGRDCAGRGTLRVLDLEQGTTSDLILLVAGPPAWSPDGTSLIVTGIVDTGPEPGPGISPPPPPAPGTQLKGVYRVSLTDQALSRLDGYAGGTAGGGRYAWGFGPDWWGPPATATPVPTATATSTRLPTRTATATATRDRRTSFMPLAQRGAALIPPTPTATMTATLTATVTATAMVTPTVSTTPPSPPATP